MIFSIDSADRGRKPALIDPVNEETWTYQKLAQEIGIRAGALQKASKSLVMQFCRNSPSMVAWYLAAIEAGHAVALLPENLDSQLRDNLIRLFRPEFILLPEAVGEHYLPGSLSPLWVRQPDNLESPPIYPELSLLLSTSGSTGSPKFVRLSRKNVEANASSIQQALGITGADRPVAHLPMHYSYGLSIINSHLVAEAPIVLTSDSLITPGFWKAVDTYQVSSFSGVPYTYQMLRKLNLDRLKAPSLTVMTQAGGKLDNDTILHFHSRMVDRKGGFWVMYGQTEAVARIAILPSGRLPAKIGSAGQAIPGGMLRIQTEDGLTTEPNLPGELVYSGPNVMLGYALERSDLGLGDELLGSLPTGDRAVLDAEGFVSILGRAKRDAKVFGLRINLDEVELLVKAHGPAAVIGGRDKLIVFCEFGDAAALKLLHGQISAKLKLHSSAVDCRRIDKLPTNHSGKIDYILLASFA